MSNTFPWRTLETPAIPSDFRAPSMALPCGSSTPDFSVTVTRAFIARSRLVPPVKTGRDVRAGHPGSRPSTLDQDRSRPLRPLVLRHDAKALCNFRIGLEQPAEIPAEPVLVELLVRLDVPQA